VLCLWITLLPNPPWATLFSEITRASWGILVKLGTALVHGKNIVTDQESTLIRQDDVRGGLQASRSQCEAAEAPMEVEECMGMIDEEGACGAAVVVVGFFLSLITPSLDLPFPSSQSHAR